MRYIFGVVSIILVLFILITLLVKGNNSNTSTGSTVKATVLTDYANKNSNVSLTTVGKMVGEEERRAIRVVVTPGERRLEILDGYEEVVTGVQSYPNTPEAYSNFLSALSSAGFLNSRKSTLDPKGTCPTGNRYVYDLSQEGSHISNLWQVSCDKSGTFAGNGPTIRQLFQLQIPDYNKQIQPVKL